MTDLELLKLSLGQLGFTVLVDSDVRGYDGQKVKADIVAVLEGNYDLGWSLNMDGSFDLIADAGGVSDRHNYAELINLINNQYARNASV
ncbi:DUF1257 domain-containing protein [Kovacikia minuta CCNUW1]|uniref:DUF1257 domain-containing protein n=1 Tax=Kovacikia minuta TaxID=2931930 RepID=UPI001CCD87CD|nr:DUF1257 domain-containing protein [Kovacikia minuta]UBF29605.1 DUF1257 domain-containing protein [Kovacikia minuta CCNUW1]